MGEQPGGRYASAMNDWQPVLAFWFAEDTKPKWWVKEAAFDDSVRRSLGPLHEQAAAGALAGWQEAPEGALALVVLLDQVPRNIFRDSPRAFATDAQARQVAASAVDRGFDSGLSLDQRTFLYLPFEHSEHLADQDRACALFAALGRADLLRYAEAHREIIRRFGRFPHRNRVLGRESTPEEAAFLQQPGSSF
jgi:uncharacterized protein (DUF924 family)